MRSNIARRYDTTMDLLDWVNVDDGGFDQYVPVFETRGSLKGYVAVDPGTGNLVLQVPDYIEKTNGILGRAVITNVRNSRGQLLSREGFGYAAAFPVPQINVFGQVYAYTYRLIESEV